jgi:hypothetical protein
MFPKDLQSNVRVAGLDPRFANLLLPLAAVLSTLAVSHTVDASFDGYIGRDAARAKQSQSA